MKITLSQGRHLLLEKDACRLEIEKLLMPDGSPVPAGLVPESAKRRTWQVGCVRFNHPGSWTITGCQPWQLPLSSIFYYFGNMRTFTFPKDYRPCDYAAFWNRVDDFGGIVVQATYDDVTFTHDGRENWRPDWSKLRPLKLTITHPESDLP